MTKFCFLFLLLISSCLLKAQVTKADYYNTIDNKIFTFSKQQPDAPFDTITSFVNSHFQTAEDRVRAYYTWIALNIKYDEDFRGASSYSLIKDIRSDNNISYRANNAMDSKLAASEGIADLMTKFCQISTIRCYTVPGYIKRPDKTISKMIFVWNVLYLDTAWVHLDASMTNGYLDEYYKFVRHPMKSYFCNPPSEFIQDHFPHDPMWQLLSYPFGKSDFMHGVSSSSDNVIYNFKDSLKIYQRKSMIEGKEIDVIRYFKYETDIELYNKNLELCNYDKASDKMEMGIEFYNKYLEIGEKKLSKYPLKSDWKVAKTYLDKAEVYLREAEKALAVFSAKKTDMDAIYDKMYFNLKNNMGNLYKNKEYLEKLKPFLKDK